MRSLHLTETSFKRRLRVLIFFFSWFACHINRSFVCSLKKASIPKICSLVYCFFYTKDFFRALCVSIKIFPCFVCSDYYYYYYYLFIFGGGRVFFRGREEGRGRGLLALTFVSDIFQLKTL